MDADVELASLGGWSYQIWRSTPPDVADAFSGGRHLPGLIFVSCDYI